MSKHTKPTTWVDHETWEQNEGDGLTDENGRTRALIEDPNDLDERQDVPDAWIDSE